MLELVVGTVVEEPQGTSARGGVVDDLGHHGAFAVEEQLVADTYLACRLYQHVPQAQLLVELAQQEHLNLGIGLLLGAIESGWEHLGVVEDKGVALVEVVEQVAEGHVFLRVVALGIFLEDIDFLAFAVNHHEFALVAVVDAVYRSVLVLEGTMWGIKSNKLFGKFEFELR